MTVHSWPLASHRPRFEPSTAMDRLCIPRCAAASGPSESWSRKWGYYDSLQSWSDNAMPLIIFVKLFVQCLAMGVLRYVNYKHSPFISETE